MPFGGIVDAITGGDGGLFDDIFDGIGGALIGGGLGFLGGERARRQTAASTREQMRFQEYMASTSYQRAMEDMRQAGLNPMLAYQQGGAATPGGASYTASDTISPAVASAMAVRRANQEQKVMRATEQKTKAETHTARQAERKIRYEADMAYHNWHSSQAKGAANASAWNALQKWYKTDAGKAAIAAEIAKVHLNPFHSIFGRGSSAQGAK